MDWFDFFMGMFVGAAICEDDYENDCAYYKSDEYEEMIFQKKLREKIENNQIFLPEHR